MTEREEGGLTKIGARLLGFDEMCRCGHEYGLHQTPGTECAVLECTCGYFCQNKFDADRAAFDKELRAENDRLRAALKAFGYDPATESGFRSRAARECPPE